MTSLFIAADGLLPKETETLAALGSLADTDELFGIKVNLDYLLARGEVRALKKLRPFGKATFLRSEDVEWFAYYG